MPPKDTGTLRYLTLRDAVRTGQKMAVLNVSGRPEFAPTQSDLERFAKAFDEGVSVFLRVHQAQKGRPTQFFEMCLQGPDHIFEELHIGEHIFTFKISPISFFQPNTRQAEILYSAALSFLKSPSLVYDLYCGTGTLGMAASKTAQKVVGIELSPEAVLDAQENLKKNGIENMEIFQGDAGKVLTRMNERPDAVLVDPPRAGLDPLAMHQLKILAPASIVYISCNPVTQAENIREFLKEGYRIKALQPVDQFPHTYHIENIAFLEK